VKTALHAFTVTLGVESERIPTTSAVNQVQLSRQGIREIFPARRAGPAALTYV